MKLVKVKIHILSTIYNGKVEGYDEVKDGKVFSLSDKINVNNADYGYSIIYEDDVFEEIAPASFVATVINLFKTHLPDTIPEFELLYHYDFILDRKSIDDDVCYPSDDTLEALIRLNNLMEKLSSNSNSEFKYIPKSEFAELLEQEHKREAEEEMSYSYDDDDDEDDDDEYDIIPTIFDSIDHYEKKRKKKKKKDTGYYTPSKILRNNKNPKKMINRHGVVVNSSKKAKKQDEKTIKNFLKDFIPGNAKWKQNLRKELAKRWIDDFVISKKKLKKLEKEERNKKKKKKNKKRTNLLSGITNNLLSQDNNWFNPNK